MKPGGRVCISSWAPVDRSPMMQAMFESMRAIKSDMPGPKTDLESLENPDVLKSEMAAAGFRDVTIHGVTKAVPINSAKELLDNMVKDSAPVTMMKNSMPEEFWCKKCEIAIGRVEEAAGPFPTSLCADAWLGVGVK